MTRAGVPSTPVQNIDRVLLKAVPPTALRILDAGGTDGCFGAALEAAGISGRRVFPGAADETDAARGMPSVEPGSLDCIVLGERLQHLHDPVAVLSRLKTLLRPDGQILCSIPNAQHYSVIMSLFSNDFQALRPGMPDPGPTRFFTASGVFKMFLDAGLLPWLQDTEMAPCPPDLLSAMEPLIRHLRGHRSHHDRLLSTLRFIVGARPLPPAPVGENPMTIIVCCNDDRQLADNLAASPCIRSGRHQVLVVRGAGSAAEGISAGLAQAVNPLVVAVHQDVYLPAGWPGRLQAQWAEAAAAFGIVGVAGAFGVSGQGDRGILFGRVVDRTNLLAPPRPLPAPVTSLDEVVLVLPRDTPLRPDPSLGWHNYGTDLAMQARAMGLQAVVLDIPCLHNSRTSDLGPDFFTSAETLMRKWRERIPFTTANVRINPDGRLLFPVLS